MKEKHHGRETEVVEDCDGYKEKGFCRMGRSLSSSMKKCD